MKDLHGGDKVKGANVMSTWWQMA